MHNFSNSIVGPGPGAMLIYKFDCTRNLQEEYNEQCIVPPTVSKIISCYDLGSYRVGPLVVWDLPGGR